MDRLWNVLLALSLIVFAVTLVSSAWIGFVLTLPDDIPPGDYFVEAGWLDMETGEQLAPSEEALSPPLRELWHSVLLPSITVH